MLKMDFINNIVIECVELYKKIKKKVKINDNEWTIISAIVGVFNENDIRVLSLGTGSKCIGQSSMSPFGDVLNDSHAEVIARRAFLKYLYHQITLFAQTQSSEIFSCDGSSFLIKDAVKFYFVTSVTPCGDASIMPKLNSDSKNLYNLKDCLNEHVITRKALKRKLALEKCSKLLKFDGNADCADIHRTGAKCLPNSKIQDPGLSGINYHQTKAVRTKPGRGDPTLSTSCSDKIAKWNALGWQGALLNLFIKSPIFMEGIICGGGCPFSKKSFDRAVNERINRKVFMPIYQSTISFPDGKKIGKSPSSLSVIWSRTEEEIEVSVNGRKQGVTKKNIFKKSARTSICKKELFLLFEKAFNSCLDNERFLNIVNFKGNHLPLKKIKYGELKKLSLNYQKKWTSLKIECFKVWSEKPQNLLNFTLEENDENNL